MVYATVEEIKAAIDKDDDGDDTIIEFFEAAAANNINNLCNRPDGFVALSTGTARTFSGNGKGYLWIPENVGVSLVEMKDSPTDTTYTAMVSGDWIAFSGDPENPDFNTIPYNGILLTADGNYSHFIGGHYTTLRGFRPAKSSVRGLPTVRVTAKWGYAVTVPPEIKQATIIQASRYYKRGQSAYGDSLANQDLGKLMFVKSLDPEIKTILFDGRYVKPATGARP